VITGLTIAVAILAGLLIGSFLNVCIYRLPRDLSVASPARSFCPACLEKRLVEMNITEDHFDDPKFKIPPEALRGSTIAWYDNIPVLSFLMLGGRCRNCRERISWRYPVVELVTAVAFGICVFKLGVTLAAAKYAILSAILITLIASDLADRILPDEFTLGGAFIGLLFAPFVPLERYFVSIFLPYGWNPAIYSVAESLFGALVGSGSIWLIAYLYEKLRHREGLGLGDVKMIAMIGAFMGLRYALETLMLASVLGAVIGLLFIFATKKDSKTYELPFGTFLGATALLLVMLGEVFAAHS
jgi:leader peptidase (prepilin peptidase) / N-methyltransferase